MRIIPGSNYLFFQIPNTKNIGGDLRINLFNAAGRAVFSATMKVAGRKFNFPTAGLSRGVYHAKITSGESCEYCGSIAITR